MFGRKVVEGRQVVPVAEQGLGGRVLAAAVEPLGELVASQLAFPPAGRVPDRPQPMAELWLETLGDLVGQVHRLVVPAALVPGLREHLAEGGPQAEGTVADRQHRRLETALTEVAQDVGQELVLSR